MFLEHYGALPCENRQSARPSAFLPHWQVFRFVDRDANGMPVVGGWVWPGLWWLEWFFLFFAVFVGGGGCVSAFCGLFATFLKKVG